MVAGADIVAAKKTLKKAMTKDAKRKLQLQRKGQDIRERAMQGLKSGARYSVFVRARAL